MKHFLLLAAALWLTAPAVLAQTPPAPSTSAPPLTAAHRQAAEQLLMAMQMERNTNTALDQMLKAQLVQRPQLQAVEPEMRAFLTKYLSWDALKDDMIDLYAREFTEKELKNLRKFYASSTGQKLVSKQTQLMAASIELGQRRMQEHLPELQQSIQNKLQMTGE